jgi:RNA recognition motif-containing protein
MLIAEFSTVGAVSSVRLAVDRESGQPKGYGLCYFLDADTAASAVRKMNRAVFRGRTLRVALADEDSTFDSARAVLLFSAVDFLSVLQVISWMM